MTKRPAELVTTTYRTVMTNNIKSFPMMSAAHATEDVLAAKRQASLIGWQENRYTDIITRHLGRGWGTWYGDTRAPKKDYLSPISWDKDVWRFIRGHKFLLNMGRAKVVETRFVTVALLEDFATGLRCRHYNLHPIAGAWVPGQRNLPWYRKTTWNNGIRKVKRRVRRDPLPVIVTLDGNDPRGNPLGTSLRSWGRTRAVHTFRNGIDYIVLVDGKNARWKSKGRRVYARNSDHMGLSLDVAIQETGAPRARLYRKEKP